MKLDNAKYDYKIAVTTTDAYYGDLFLNSGCSLCKEEQTAFRFGNKFKNKIIDNLTPNKALSLQENLVAGSTGSGDERPFSSIFASLNSKLNTDFLRENSTLLINILTDEDDFSHSKMDFNEDYSNPELFTIDKVISNLDALILKNNMNSYWLHIISVLDSSCQVSLSGSTKIGKRLNNFVEISQKGSYQSICGFNTK